jgi:hypothetical protein
METPLESSGYETNVSTAISLDPTQSFPARRESWVGPVNTQFASKTRQSGPAFWHRIQ